MSVCTSVWLQACKPLTWKSSACKIHRIVFHPRGSKCCFFNKPTHECEPHCGNAASAIRDNCRTLNQISWLVISVVCTNGVRLKHYLPNDMYVSYSTNLCTIQVHFKKPRPQSNRIKVQLKLLKQLWHWQDRCGEAERGCEHKETNEIRNEFHEEYERVNTPWQTQISTSFH